MTAIHDVALDRTFTRPLLMGDESTGTALAIQWSCSLGRSTPTTKPRVPGDEQIGEGCCPLGEVLHGLATDPMSLARQLDWVAKLQLIEAYRDRHGLDWDDHRLAALDLQYHDLRPSGPSSPAWTPTPGGRGLGRHRGQPAPPGDPGLVPGGVPEEVAGRGGHRQLGLPGVRPRHRPPAARPYDGSLKGTAEHVEELLDACSSPSELLDRLSS